MDSVYDLIIVGGGPAGLSAAIYAGRSERRTLLLEKGSYGGRINDTYEIRNYPGTKADSGQHLMELFREHAAGHPTVELKRTTVTGVRKEDDTFIVETKRRGGFHGTQRHPGSGHQAQGTQYQGREGIYRAWGLLTVRPAMRNSSRERKSMCWEPVTRPLRNRII